MSQLHLFRLDVLNSPGDWTGPRKLHDRAAACQKCPDLCGGRARVVMGSGKLERPLLALVGTFPQGPEEEIGLPIAGKRAAELEEIAAEIELDLKDCFLVNLIACRTPTDRLPREVEIANCYEFLTDQLRLVRPLVIVAMGKEPRRVLADNSLPGEWAAWSGFPVLATRGLGLRSDRFLFRTHLEAAKEKAIARRKKEARSALRDS